MKGRIIRYNGEKGTITIKLQTIPTNINLNADIEINEGDIK